MYFLGTPHQGSDSAIYLKVALSMPLPTGSKAYVNDLLPDCPTVQSINDEFRHVCDKVELWSFWEAKPTAGFWIVPKSKAVMSKSILLSLACRANGSVPQTCLVSARGIFRQIIDTYASLRTWKTRTTTYCVNLSLLP